MNKNLFVRNISYKATNQDLKSFFETVGTVVSAKIIFDKENNRSKGYGFVEFATEEEAEKAIQQLDGASLLEREISIQPAKPRE